MSRKTILGNGVLVDGVKAGVEKATGAAKAEARGKKAAAAGEAGTKGEAVHAGEAGQSGEGIRAGEAGQSGDGIHAGEAGENGEGIRAGEAGENGEGIRAGEAQRSFEAVRPMLEALGPGEIVAPRIDVGRAAAIVNSVLVRDGAPERRAAFEKLAQAGYYDLAMLDELPRLARAAWYLRGQQLTAAYDATGALVAEEDSSAAYATRARMMLVLGHWLGDRRDIAPRLQQLREGSGYQDLARDLEMLSEIYGRDDVRAIIAHDIKHYRAGDKDEAERLAGLIYRAIGLGEQGQAERIAGLTYRAAVQMLRAYDEHRACGQFLFRKVEDVTATYPSIYRAVRTPRRRRSADEAPDGEGPDAEEPGGEGEPSDEGPAVEVPLGGS